MPFAQIGVAITPGCTQTTRTPCAATSRRSASVTASRPNFDAT